MATRGGRTGGRPQGLPMLNLERVPPLAPKFANQIGKTCTGFRIQYVSTGTTVEVASLVDAEGGRIDTAVWTSIPEWERRRALFNAPDAEERLSALKRKYELRLNRAFPGNGPASGEEADIQAWLGTLPFAQRRALLMSQKDFAKSFPDGFRE
jgi:hypothetical protein